MSVRNLLPKSANMPNGAQVYSDNDAATAAAFVSLTGWIDSLTDFLSVAIPRGGLPQGPDTVTAAAQADSIRVSWKPERTNAVIDFFWVYRAQAGTVGTPTTPTFGSAIRKAFLPAHRGLPSTTTQDYSWFDLEWSSADRVAADKKRYAYWVSSVDTEWRESPLVAASAIVTQP